MGERDVVTTWYQRGNDESRRWWKEWVAIYCISNALLIQGSMQHSLEKKAHVVWVKKGDANSKKKNHGVISNRRRGNFITAVVVKTRELNV